MDLSYSGSGIAMLTLIDSTGSATIRHSESEPIASEAATALVNRDEATGAAWSSKPAARGDRIMAGKSSNRGRITRGTGFSQESQAIFGRRRPESGKTTAGRVVMPAVSSVSGLGGNTGRIGDFEIGTPVHGDVARGLLDPPQPCADRRECSEVEIALVRDMGVTI